MENLETKPCEYCGTHYGPRVTVRKTGTLLIERKKWKASRTCCVTCKKGLQRREAREQREADRLAVERIEAAYRLFLFPGRPA